MNHQDHVSLIEDGITSPGGIWADFGSGTGAFTLALAELLGPDGQLHSIDKNAGSLRTQQKAFHDHFGDQRMPTINYVQADYTSPIELPRLDGVIMANSLHFQRKKEPVLGLIYSHLRIGGGFILVEYNIDRGNPWVPYPLSYSSWEKLAERTGFTLTRMLARRPSSLLKEIYSAMSIR